MCDLADFEHLELLPRWRKWLEDELEHWHHDYLPLTPPEPKRQEPVIVLDVGAGCGETAQFFLNHGAQRVIAIEADPEAFACLYRNAERHFTFDRVEPIHAGITKAKLDFESWEEGLDIEIHFPYTLEERRRVTTGQHQMRLVRTGERYP